MQECVPRLLVMHCVQHAIDATSSAALHATPVMPCSPKPSSPSCQPIRSFEAQTIMVLEVGKLPRAAMPSGLSWPKPLHRWQQRLHERLHDGLLRECMSSTQAWAHVIGCRGQRGAGAGQAGQRSGPQRAQLPRIAHYCRQRQRLQKHMHGCSLRDA